MLVYHLLPKTFRVAAALKVILWIWQSITDTQDWKYILCYISTCDKATHQKRQDVFCPLFPPALPKCPLRISRTVLENNNEGDKSFDFKMCYKARVMR